MTGQLDEEARNLRVCIGASSSGVTASCNAHTIHGDMTVTQQMEPQPTVSAHVDIPTSVGTGNHIRRRELAGGEAGETLVLVTS